MKNLTWQNPEQLFVAQELINKVKSECCGIKDIALAAALAGSFKELVNLKEQGYKLSAKELDALKDADPKIYIAAQNIFNIKLDDPTPSLQFSESKNKNEVKQLSLNF